MKRRSMFFILAAFFAVMLPVLLSGKVQAATDGFYTYEVVDGIATITDVDSAISGDITIPETLGGYPVTAIGERAFQFCSKITSVAIGANITSIGKSAFQDCHGNKSFTVDPDNPSYYFDEYGSLFTKDMKRLLHIPLAKTGTYEVPDGTEIIGVESFYSCSLKSVVLPESVTRIEPFAFAFSYNITSLNIPNQIQFVGRKAFESCNRLPKTTYDNGTYLGSEENPYLLLLGVTTEDIITFDIHPDTRAIGGYAFQNCKSLQSIVIPEGIAGIGDYAFYGCTLLSHIDIPEGITTLSNSVFCDSGLVSISLPTTVTELERSAFYRCNKLTDLYYAGSPSMWKAVQIGDNNYRLQVVKFHFAMADPGDLDGVEGVTEQDAAYLLKHTLFPDEFPLNQDADFDKSGVVDEMDAFYLLQHILFPEEFPL